MVKNRGGHGHGCPYCAGKRVDATNSLATRFPEIAEQWHPTKNGKLVAIDVSFGSNKKVWWHCDMKHSYQANVVARTSRNRGCPYCAGKRAHKERNLAIEHPKLIREWNTVKNRELQPTEITSGSNMVDMSKGA